MTSFSTFVTHNGFLLFLGLFPFGLGFAFGGVFWIKGLGLNVPFGWALFLLIRLRTVEGASIFVTPRLQKKLPISLWDWAFSAPYFDRSLISLQRFNPSDLAIPNNYPNDNKLNGISLVPNFWRSLLKILSPKSFGSLAMNLSFQNGWRPSSLFKTFDRKTSLYHL